MIVGAASTAAGVLVTQMTYQALSLSGESCARATQAASCTAAGLASALLPPGLGAITSSLALCAGAGLSQGIALSTLVLATGASAAAGLTACVAVTASVHAGAALAAAAARLRARQVGFGTWAAGLEDGRAGSPGRLEDGLDALPWVELGGEGGGALVEGAEEAAPRLYSLLASRTTPRSARCALEAFVELAADCGTAAAPAAAPADAARARWLLVPLPPSPAAFFPAPGQ